LALLKCKKIPGRRAIELAPAEPGLYEKGLIMGTASGLYGTGAEVVISGMDGSNGSRTSGKFYQFSGPIASGMSGGILSNIDGQLIGVPHLLERDEDMPLGCIGFAVPLPIVKAFLEVSIP
jgi:S1-C subfamily serine protease